MSLTEFNVIVEKKNIVVIVEPPRTAIIQTPSTPGVIVLAAGNVGPPGPSGVWEALTQAEYDALTPPNPDVLYVIIQ